MLPNWLTGSQQGRQNNNADDRHVVLGTPLHAPLMDDQEEIIFGCGCFWGAEKGFWRLPGVVSTAVGYAGGQVDSPFYEQVCSGRTGHTEVVRVVWSAPAIDVSDLLKLFWECHDPTQGDRQGNDQGSQYRSAIYTTNARQMELALASRESYQRQLTEAGKGIITTEIAADRTFYFAEAYHQQYLARPGSRPYCSAMPTGLALEGFPGAQYRLPSQVWSHYDWSISHCILRGDNRPIELQA
ncbi:peptide methionine sulfoxide reductase [Synechococcus sp. A18-25c]|uniref:peptide-methionine (S)-S-oxide reductase MsrA n=1 Tax=unclassified Synechococcus TaxID=2626047 RepID=UPI000C57A3FC|nr:MULTISPECIES: peptide-methionine (S)-S-oxide reductase MsrA [unclassified Synechococcus]MAN20373.1 peptide-methionine (S)-S-oxide reductase [Synechococcus sp. EAC657]MEC8096262.1 peptide-methionine (S)-S-oxide reductase MsrA [Cyanobacteriota bacterium]QNI48655.1 peptide methionine sulfoxide reductase [Synechococcus sp. A15-60]QNJ20281.1 peptide methionine sulfoxide reductase [Synechococcus sp. A18-25c]